jgi:hypothetical protein
MSITFRCNCGKKLQVSDDMAGKQVRCGACQSVQSVPSAVVATVRPARPEEISAARAERPADEPAPGAKRPRRVKKSGGSSALLFILLGVGAVILLGCLGVGGFLVYYFGFSGKSSESTLVGDWEIDPDATPIVLFPIRITFNKDHTYRMQAGFDFDGTWRVTSRDGSKLQLTMTTSFMGMKPDRPAQSTVTFIDKDHIQFDADSPGMQASNTRFRRVGSGGKPLTPGGGMFGGPPNPDAKPDPNKPGLGERGKANPDVDKGMVADCEVLWGGQWFEAKVLKTEKDRWFIHYIGWANNWDEWVGKDRIRFKN